MLRRSFGQMLLAFAVLGALTSCDAGRPTDPTAGRTDPLLSASAEPLFQRFIVAPGSDPSVLPMNVDALN